jgi:hypothetical protein
MSNDLTPKKPTSTIDLAAELFRRWTWSTIILAGALGLLPAQAHAATYAEVEPDNTCATAQNLEYAPFPLQVKGFKSVGSNAVDFFKFRGVPGTQVGVTLNGDSSSPNPLTSFGVGFFPSNCPAIAQSSNFNIFSPAHLEFTVPADGKFVIAVTACCDTNFSGSGTIQGAYILTVTGTSPGGVAAPVGSNPADQSYGRWAAAFWQWVLGVPDNKFSAQSGNQRVNPLKDKTGAWCAQHQIGDVWFLAGSWVGMVSRSCTIPAGKSLFFPLINNVYVGFLSDPPDQRTEKWARDHAACTNPAQIAVSVDGIPVDNPLSYFTGSSGSLSPVFNVQMPFGIEEGGSGNLLKSQGYKIKQIPEWFLSPSAEQGYYLFLSPLRAGPHSLRWTATGCSAGGNQDVTYSLFVLSQ